MANEWRLLNLEEAGIELIDCVHKTPQAVDRGHPYIAIPQMSEGRIDYKSARQISHKDFDAWTRKALPKAHDLVLSRRCNPGVTAYVTGETNFALGQNLVLLRANGQVTFPPFLRWLARGPAWWGEVARFLNVGAVFDSLKCADVPKFSLPFPPISEQRAIAHVLGTLDDKIECNRRLNRTLEGIVRALFKSWFIDFDPVLDNAILAGNPIPDEFAERAELRRMALDQNQPSPGLRPPSPSGRGAGGEGAQHGAKGSEEVNYRGGYDFTGMLETVRELRRSQTPTEAVLWELLRGRRFLGLKFRRQHQIGDYVADFYCHEAKLVVELDGGVHADKVAKDHKRDAFMESLGLTVLRFPNEQLLDAPESVLQAIADCAKPSAELPSTSGRGLGGEGVVDFHHLFPAEFTHTDTMGSACAGMAGRWIPKGWEVVRLFDLCTKVQNGGTPQRNNPDFWTPPMIPWLSSGEVRQSIITRTNESISELGLQNSSAKWIPSGATVVALYGATAGQVAFVAAPMTTNQAVCALIPKASFQYFNYLALSTDVGALANLARGSAQQNISKGIVETMKTIRPRPNVSRAFEERCMPLLEKWISNLKLNERLSALRDTLLPKLLTGEVTVPIAATSAEEAGR